MRYTVTIRDEGYEDEVVVFDTEAVAARLKADPTDDGSNVNDLQAALEVIRMYERTASSAPAATDPKV